MKNPIKCSPEVRDQTIRLVFEQPVGNIPPAEFKATYYRQLGESTDTA